MVRFAQWILGLAVVISSGVATLVLLSPGEADHLRKANEALAREKFELQRAVERLSSESRMAEVYVVDQVHKGEMSGDKPAETDLTTLDFVEIDRQGHPLPSRRMTVCGTSPRFESLVILFGHEHVAMGDALRGKSLALFRGVYGEQQRPVDAVLLDKAGEIPNIYRVNPEPNELERRLWDRFWDYARNPAQAERDGVRLAQGDTKFVPMRKGDVWTISLQHNAGLNIKLRYSNPQSSAESTGDQPAGGR